MISVADGDEIPYPPIVPTTLEKLQDLSTNLDRLSIHQLPYVLKSVEAPRDTKDLYQIHPVQAPFALQFMRDPETGKILSYKEVETSSLGETAKNSLSLTRAPGSASESVKGNSTNLPFWPGGFDDVKQRDFSFDTEADFSFDESQIDDELFGAKEFLTSPPGLPMVSIEIADRVDPERIKDFSTTIENEIEKNLDFWHVTAIPAQDRTDSVTSGRSKTENNLKRLLREIPDDLSIPTPANDNEKDVVPVLKISAHNVSAGLKKKEWAEMVDVSKPMSDFHERVPDMAFRYPFELDTFQQHAICRLEEHENVFVAAHTSAGKTVVAEYAISLSVRHMTKTVYTSPIKALSNQKFRDFKNNFESVGLITGDVQINPTASCLIMTTEILRSMLYNGSDTIRDLEWVIFDEIHYLNNEERGHVWEEVLIMLPDHVSIIMLSATVPNALDFANWVGGIKKKKIYVISTLKRPVPLEHFLYTGTGGKSRNEQFPILEGASTKLNKAGYQKATEAKEGRKSKYQQTHGSKSGNQPFSENFEKTLYSGLISHLQSSEKLPVVVFTFSRNKCDTYARMLSESDLCTGQQKAEIHGFFQRSIDRLKGSDRDLPQVQQVYKMLTNGIGVHHSGILPILKEVVEMLFQRGLVKLLFATETFAMGVNMPARTVVFDSIRKHDGTQFRTLNAAEYIQMAGRAGRRGLDTTGTVLILCKQQVPPINDLEIMMLGQAAKLSSQFRLTYSMILNLLRVETLSVEDVMKRSFLEAGSTTMNAGAINKKLTTISKKLEELEFEPRDQNLASFYNHVKEYTTTRDGVVELLYSHPRIAKDLTTGRFIVFESLPKLSPRVGLILAFVILKENNKPMKKFKVLHLTSQFDKDRMQDGSLQILNFPGIELLEGHKLPEVLDRKFQLYLYYAHDRLTDFVPDTDVNYPRHEITYITSDNILTILEESTKLDPAVIENDIKKREAPRFREDEPSRQTALALKQLLTIGNNYENKKYEYKQLVRQFKGLEPQMFESMKRMDEVGATIKQEDYYSMVQNFVQQFREVFFYMRLVDEKEHLNYLLSPRSLRLHAEYKARIDVLRELGYIDSENLVQLKGRVACEMGNQNELMMTEIIFNNILSDCPPHEVAALLSCMVFEAKHVPEPRLPPDSRLRKKIEAIKLEARRIGEVQRANDVTESIDAFVEQFKFGLVEVVYEWAQGKPFSNIMNLTEVQEGLIVRTIQRLDEMLKDVKDAARIIGDPTLKKKMEEASECIKRDIVFAASLYTQ